MSALSTTTPPPPPTKRAKTEAAQTPKVRGIGLVIRSEDALALSPGEKASPSPSVRVMDGDRTRKAPGIWDEWSEEFHGEEPHNVYMVDVNTTGNYEPLYVPAAAHKTGDAHQYTALECGKAMLKHALRKKWVPKCVVEDQAEYDAIVQHIDSVPKSVAKAYVTSIVDKLEPPSVQKFINLCVRYTKRVLAGDTSGRPYLLTEVVCGKIERGDSADDTAAKEGFEESGAPSEFLKATMRSTGLVSFTTSRGTSWSATYECRIQKAQMDEWWGVQSAYRKGLTNWFCAHGWFSYLPGIVEGVMESLKGLCETSNARWVSEETAAAILDDKSLNVFKHVIRHVNA